MSRTSNVARRYLQARSWDLNTGTIQGLRKEFLTLMKNADRADSFDMDTAERFRKAVIKWCDQLEVFGRQIREDLEGRIRLAEHPIPGRAIPDKDWAKHYLNNMKPYWELHYEMRNVPVVPDLQGVYGGKFETPEAYRARLLDFFREKYPEKNAEREVDGILDRDPPITLAQATAKAINNWSAKVRLWEQRARSKARAAWKFLDALAAWITRDTLYMGGGGESIRLEMPDEEIINLEGFRVIMRGAAETKDLDKDLGVLREGLRRYRDRAQKVLPLMLKLQAPIFMDMSWARDHGGAAGRYDFGKIIMTPWTTHDPNEFVRTLAHEMGHHLYRVYLSGDMQRFWTAAIRGDYKDLDLREALATMERVGASTYIDKQLMEADPILYLQLGTINNHHSYKGYDLWSQTSIRDYLAKGENPIVRVPAHPITGYAGKNEEEAFCETIGMLVAYGPRAVLPEVRQWLQIMMPEVRVANTLLRPRVLELPIRLLLRLRQVGNPIEADKCGEIDGRYVCGDDFEYYEALVESIRRHGVREPVSLAAWGGRPRVVDGHHRLSAAWEAGLKTVPVLVDGSISDDQLDAMGKTASVAARWTIQGVPFTDEVIRDNDRLSELGSDTDLVMNMMVKELNKLRFPLTIYRGMHIAEGKKYMPEHVTFGNVAGGHWTWDREVAEHFARGTHTSASDSGEAWHRGDQALLLSAKVGSPRDVDWIATAGLYVGFSDPYRSASETENEIVVERASHVEVERLDGKTASEGLLPGGVGRRKHPSDFDADELQRGIQVEQEHLVGSSFTDEEKHDLAQEIAMDHLSEIPDYYTRLDHMEGEAKTAKARYQEKKKVPKADGKGTTTVYVYSERQVANRNKAKAERIDTLRHSMDDLRKQVTKDLGSKDAKTRLTALAVGLIDATFERVGNDDSADDGHYGVTGWLKSHVSFKGGKATIKYVGKSGVDHVKTVDDKKLVAALKDCCEGKGKDDTILSFGSEDGESTQISSRDVNSYLKPFDVTAKDLRGYHANREMQDQLRAIRKKGPKLPEDKKEKAKLLKDEFKQALEAAAEAVGHEASTLKSQYLVPGLEDTYLKDGTVMDTMKVANMIRRVANRWVDATKTPAEKEDAEAERLIRKSPKLKPSRNDSKRERVKVDDPDMADHDVDMSLNRKDVGG